MLRTRRSPGSSRSSGSGLSRPGDRLTARGEPAQSVILQSTWLDLLTLCTRQPHMAQSFLVRDYLD